MKKQTRRGRLLLSESTAFLEKRPSARKYREALSELLPLSEKVEKALIALVGTPDHTLANFEIVRIAGWKSSPSSGAVGLRLGTLGRQVAEELGILDRQIKLIRNEKSYSGHYIRTYKTCAIAAEHFLYEGGKPTLHWMLYPEIVEALLDLGIGDRTDSTGPVRSLTEKHIDGRIPETDPTDAVEGEPKVIKHIRYERSHRLNVAAKRRYADRHAGRLPCEICGFEFETSYGELGIGFIEAHHLLPLSRGVRSTMDEGFMMLCRNCHFMVHKLLIKKGQVNRKQAMKILKVRPKSQRR